MNEYNFRPLHMRLLNTVRMKLFGRDEVRAEDMAHIDLPSYS